MHLAIPKFCCGYNSRAATIRGRLVMAILRYVRYTVKSILTNKCFDVKNIFSQSGRGNITQLPGKTQNHN